jgi:hypothetical protein
LWTVPVIVSAAKAEVIQRMKTAEREILDIYFSNYCLPFLTTSSRWPVQALAMSVAKTPKPAARRSSEIHKSCAHLGFKESFSQKRRDILLSRLLRFCHKSELLRPTLSSLPPLEAAPRGGKDAQT